jgi:hypothetical protein
MRYVAKDLTKIPPSLQSLKALRDIEKIAAGDKTIISDTIYKGDYKDAEGKSQSQVRDYLNKYYHHKCAYCEQFCKAEIEHYRPKKGIIEDSTHDGYYWLCYSWSNLVPSCRYCNTEGGKGNKFPIINETKRVKKPTITSAKLDKNKCEAHKTPLINEEPYLLHPEIDKNPEKFLAFRINNDKTGVEIFGIDAKNRGKTTIGICNLNRTDLVMKRLAEVYFTIKQKIKIIFLLSEEGRLPNEQIEAALKLVFREVEKESVDEKLTYTLLRKFIIESTNNFENYFSPYLENDSVREITVLAFRNYKSEL